MERFIALSDGLSGTSEPLPAYLCASFPTVDSSDSVYFIIHLIRPFWPAY